MTTPHSAGKLIVKHKFSCSACSASAGVVKVFLDGDEGVIVCSSFTSELESSLGPKEFARVRKAVTHQDMAALYRCDPEFAPSYCPKCKLAYCGRHWKRSDVFEDDGWHDSIRGRCPKGHERMLED